MATLELRNVNKTYGAGLPDTLKNIELSIKEGEFLILVGPSGCGKSTLMNCIAGLETITGGAIMIGDQDVSGMSPKDRDIAMVFQSYALYPTMSVRENMIYGLKIAKMPKAEIEERLQRAAKMLALEPYLDRKPRALSGGQRQRVAMGRALVRDPAAFLLDEPLSNLDAKLRDEARAFLKELIKREERAAVIVTHDQIEALAIADTIVLLNGGVIAQEGSPEDLYSRPKTLFTADFIGSNARLTGRVTEARDGFAVLDCDGLTVTGRMGHEVRRGDEATAICRLERLSLGSPGEPDCIEMDRATTMFLGEKWENVYRTGPHSLRVLTDGPVPEGRALVRIPRDSVWVF